MGKKRRTNHRGGEKMFNKVLGGVRDQVADKIRGTANQYKNCTDPEEVAVFFDDAVYIDNVNILARFDKEKQGLVKVKSNTCPWDHTISLVDLSIKARGPKEDEAFALDIQLIKNLRRGNTLIEFRDQGGTELKGREIARKGLLKFFDLMIEFIDPATRYNDNMLSIVDRGIKNYIMAGPLKSILKGHQVEIIKTLKANGENAQVSYNPTSKAWIIASKNRAIAVRTRADIDKHSKDVAEFAMEMAECWFDYLDDLKKNPDGEQWIAELKKDIANRTLVGEYVGAQKHQHMVKYNRRTLIFYAVVDNNSGSICWPHERALALFQKHELDCVKIESLGLYNSYDGLCDALYKAFRDVAKSKITEEEEGSVLYLTQRHSSGDPAKDKVLSLCKLKTLEYRIFRKIREKLRNYFKSSSSKMPSTVVSHFRKEMNELMEGNSLPKPISFYEQLMTSAFDFIRTYPKMLDLLNEEYITFQEKLLKYNAEHNKLEIDEYESLFDSKVLDTQDQIKYQRPQYIHQSSSSSKSKVYDLVVVIVVHDDHQLSNDTLQEIDKHFIITNSQDQQQLQPKPILQIVSYSNLSILQTTTTATTTKYVIYGLDQEQSNKVQSQIDNKDSIAIIHDLNEDKLVNQLLHFKSQAKSYTLKCQEEEKNQSYNQYQSNQEEEKKSYEYRDVTPSFGSQQDQIQPSQESFKTAQDTIYQTLDEYYQQFGQLSKDLDKKLVIVIIPFGVIGSGKSTFYKKLKTICEQKLGWACQTVSSDDIRKAEMDKLMSEKKLSKEQAFERTQMAGVKEFERQFKQLISESGQGEEPVKVIFIDKNHPRNGIPKANQIIMTSLPENVKLLKFYLLPRITKAWYKYPFSSAFLLQCYYRLINRTDHGTLDNSYPQKSAELLFSFFKSYENEYLNEGFLNEFKLNGYFYAPLTVPDDTVIIPKQIENAMLDVLKKTKRGGGGSNNQEEIKEFMKIAEQYKTIFDGKDLDQETEEFLILDQLMRISAGEFKEPKEEVKQIVTSVMTRSMTKSAGVDPKIPIYIGVALEQAKNFKKQRNELFTQVIQELIEKRPTDDFTELEEAIKKLKTKGVGDKEGWKFANDFHVTCLFLGKNPDIAEKSDLYQRFKDGQKVAVEVQAVVMVRDRILTGVCFPPIETDNEFPHVTMMFKYWKAKDSNLALETTCSKDGVFYSDYKKLKDSQETSDYGSGDVKYAKSVMFGDECHPAYFITLAKPIKFEGVTKPMEKRSIQKSQSPMFVKEQSDVNDKIDREQTLLYRNESDFELSRLVNCHSEPIQESDWYNQKIIIEIHKDKLIIMGIRTQSLYDQIYKEVDFIDLLGTEIDQDRKNVVKIHSFPKSKSLSGNPCRSQFKLSRRLKELRIITQNDGMAYELGQRIQYAKRGQLFSQDPIRPRKILVLINPFSGQRLAETHWTIAQPILEKANMELEVVRTQYAGHAYEVAKGLKPGDYDGLITVSGDGLLHEVINALYTRSDCTQLLKAGLTFGVIPGGTSNGLCKALVDVNDEDYTVENAAYLIARGRKGWMDLTEIDSEYQPDKKIYAFLSVFWGVLADCDINSECIRWMGTPRFTLWGVMRVFLRKIYQGSIKYDGYQIKNRNEETLSKLNQEQSKSRKEEFKSITLLQAKDTDSTLLKDRPFTYVLIQNTPFIGHHIHSAPLASLNDGFNDMILQEADQGRARLANILIQQDDGTYFDNEGNIKTSLGITYHKCKEWTIDPLVKTTVDINHSMSEHSNLIESSRDESLVTGAYQFDRNAFFSIDGEKYPACRITGRVIRNALPIFY